MPLNHFDLVARIYDRVLPYSGPEPILRLLNVRDGLRVLDVGGGTGRVSSTFGCDCLLVVCDASWTMGREARSKGLPVCTGEGERLPFVDGAFDRLVMVDVFHHLADHRAAAREVVRVLAPGGLAVIEDPDIRYRSVKWLALAERVALMRSTFFAPADMAEMFRAAGAGRVEVHEERPNVRLVVTAP
ncbi:MAG: methyltransferase domain-containing protein [Anaerolineae bacterium]|nr:methyltransferase domain-containing protein [Anaerolineae bacterium]